MNLCRVTGSVVATAKHERLTGHRLLLVRPLALDGTVTDRAEEVALDPGLDAGIGDTVLIAKEGAVVADLFDRAPDVTPTPANVVIVAVVEAWTADARG
jgi:microcompartment protein CcmK/EutM